MTGVVVPPADEVLVADQVSVAYGNPDAGGTLVIPRACLSLRRGEMIAVTGPSGSGKSSLVDTLALMRRPASGEVLINGQATSALPEGERSAIRRRHIGYLFQSFNLISHLSAVDNVILGFGRADRRSAERAKELLACFGIGRGDWDRIPSMLSVGQRQRVGLARALAKEPALLLADEPTGNLDGENAAAVTKVLRAYADDGAAVLIVTHAEQMVMAADRAITISALGNDSGRAGVADR